MIWKSKREDAAVAVLPVQVQAARAFIASTPTERSLDQQLREATEQSHFRVDYQPLVSVPDGAVVGVEAFLRWDSDAGPISPSRFVPILEAAGLIGQAGEWILAEACGELAAWPRPDGPGLLTVNVSAYQLVPGFADQVVGILAATGFPAERLCLELTNPARLDDASTAWSELRRLKACDVRLFIDDFGTAGASIVDLKRFVVDAVKIDTSFIKGLGREEEDHAIVAALIGLAHALGMLAIAEGVETAQQLEALKALGCDMAQGYHFGVPGPARQVRNLLNGAA